MRSGRKMPRQWSLRAPRLAVVAALIAGMWSGVSCRPQARPAHPMRWARAWIMALNSHDVAYFPPLFGPAGTYQDPFTSRPVLGWEIGFVFARRWRGFPNVHYEIERVTGDSGLVVVEWTASGFGPAMPDHTVRGIFVIAVRGDTIASVRGY